MSCRNSMVIQGQSTPRSNGSIDLERSPSQLSSLTTTVPQSLVLHRVEGRHTPTKRSLRHSRMLNVTINGGYRQPIMNNCKLAAVLVSQQLVVGIILSCIAFYTGSLSPSLKMRDVPTWAGLPLAFTGLFGTLFVSCCHREYPGNCGVFTMKAISFILSVISVILCLCTVSFLAVHMVTMTTYNDCSADPDAAESVVTCVCRIRTDPSRDRIYVYDHLSCDDVVTVLRMLFVVMSVLSCLGVIFSLWYTVLLWGSRYEYFYAGLRSNEDAAVPTFRS